MEQAALYTILTISAFAACALLMGAIIQIGERFIGRSATAKLMFGGMALIVAIGCAAGLAKPA